MYLVPHEHPNINYAPSKIKLIECGTWQLTRHYCPLDSNAVHQIKKYRNAFCYLIIYVDDIIVAVTTSNSSIEEIKIHITTIFEIRDLGISNYYLGIQVQRDEDGIYNMNQHKNINEIIRDFGLGDSNPSNFPMDPGYYNFKDEDFSVHHQMNIIW